MASRRFVVVLTAVCLCSCSRDAPPAGFWFVDNAISLPSDSVARLGGPLSSDEKSRIDQVARAEIVRAFADYRIRIVEGPSGYWKVAVVRSIPVLGELPGAGQSMHFGVLGGSGSVGFDALAAGALRHAPPDASRQVIIDAIARGIGRAAVHEFVHQIVGPGMRDDRTDPLSYEYFTADRAAQFYGELHWGVARTFLLDKLKPR